MSRTKLPGPNERPWVYVAPVLAIWLGGCIAMGSGGWLLAITHGGAGIAIYRRATRREMPYLDRRVHEQWAECMAALRIVNPPHIAPRPDGSNGIKRSRASTTLDVLIPSAGAINGKEADSAGTRVLSQVSSLKALGPSIKMELGGAAERAADYRYPWWAVAVLTCTRWIGGDGVERPHLGNDVADVKVQELRGNRARIIITRNVEDGRIRTVRVSPTSTVPVFDKRTGAASVFSESLGGWVYPALRYLEKYDPIAGDPDDDDLELLDDDEAAVLAPTADDDVHEEPEDDDDTEEEADPFDAWEWLVAPRSDASSDPDFSLVEAESAEIFQTGEGSGPDLSPAVAFAPPRGAPVALLAPLKPPESPIVDVMSEGH